MCITVSALSLKCLLNWVNYSETVLRVNKIYGYHYINKDKIIKVKIISKTFKNHVKKGILR